MEQYLQILSRKICDQRFLDHQNYAMLFLVIQSCPTLCDPWTTACQALCHEDSPGKNTAVGCPALLQGIFPTQGLNPGVSPCKQILYYLSQQGSPRILEWVAYSFSRGSSWSRKWTRVSYMAGRFFTSWATREAPSKLYPTIKIIKYF